MLLKNIVVASMAAEITTAAWISREHGSDSHGHVSYPYGDRLNATRVCTEDFRGENNTDTPWGISATITITPGKVDRVKELLDANIAYFIAEEPDTLVFEYYEQIVNGSSVIELVEKYRNYAALVAHESSEVYASFFQRDAEENLLQNEPQPFRGKLVGGFNRLTCLST